MKYLLHTHVDLWAKLNNCQEQIDAQRYIDLIEDGVFTSSNKRLDLEILLNPAEEDFNLPALPLDSGNCLGLEVEIVCLGIFVSNSLQKDIGPFLQGMTWFEITPSFSLLAFDWSLHDLHLTWVWSQRSSHFVRVKRTSCSRFSLGQS